MKILFLTYDVPYPLNSGGKIRAYHLLKSLAQRNQLTLFSYYRSEDQKKYLGELEKYCSQIFLFKRRKAWSWQNFCLTFLMPFAAAGYYSSQLEKELKKELAGGKYDLVHFESFYPALYLPTVKKLGLRTVLGNENLEYLVYRRYANSQPRWLRSILSLEVERLWRFEEKLWRLADLNLQASKSDALEVEKITGKPCLVVANGVNFEKYQTVDYHQNRKAIIYVGNLVYPANTDAVGFFLEKIYPKIRKRVEGVKFILVSGYEPRWLKRYINDPSIEYFKDTMTPAAQLLLQADVLVAPMRIASGTNIKILEAMAAGLPVVTTSIGAEGLKVTNQGNIIIADRPEEMADLTAKLLTNQPLREKIGRKARQTIEDNYDWSKTTQGLDLAYRKLINGKT
ncbi:MAG: glycosyltransferase family 4 protein [Candidatus Shapirobacteria bacterium]